MSIFRRFYETIKFGTQHTLGADEAALIDEAAFDPYKTALFGAWREEQAIVDKAIISFDEQLLDQRTAALFGADPAVPVSYRKVTGDTIIYHWSNQFNAEPFFDYLSQSVPTEPGAADSNKPSTR